MREYKMYGLVPYNISPIQQGIQFGHAKDEYTLQYYTDEDFQKWARVDKTYIILDGGTTNLNPHRLGTLNEHLQSVKDFGFKVAEFYEPDLGDQLTAFVFLVPETIWDRKKYPLESDNTRITLTPEETEWQKIFPIADLIEIGLKRNFLKKFKTA